jgi:hypothetical protein
MRDVADLIEDKQYIFIVPLYLLTKAYNIGSLKITIIQHTNNY